MRLFAILLCLGLLAGIASGAAKPVVTMRIAKPYAGRTPGARGAMRAAHGGNAMTEGAVMRALRWLKKHQLADGSWKMVDREKGRTYPATAAASFALLTFLGHGETPDSTEFGTTVEKAIGYILAQQKADGRFNNVDGHEYALPIAAYALCEAYGLTMSPDVKDAAQKVVRLIIRGQNSRGGWDYRLKAGMRSDTSYMGWCAQALMAAQMAGMFAGDQQVALQESAAKAVTGFKGSYKAVQEGVGGFGYTTPGTKLAGIGVFSTQILGAPGADEVFGGLNWIAMNEQVDWDEPRGKTYTWYYSTHAMFMAGGDKWREWNKQMAPTLVRNQIVADKKDSGYVDGSGRPQETGYWDCPAGGSGSGIRLLDTCLSAMQLEVYYRYPREWTWDVPAPMELEPLIKALIGKLDAESFAEREAATKELMEMRPSAAPLIKKLGQGHEDPEVRARIKRVVEALAAKQ